MNDFPDRTTSVTIYGETYNIRGKTDPEFIEKVAGFVDDKMQEIGANLSSGTDPHRIAILAAMNIAGELFQSLQDRKDILDTVNRRGEQLISAIEKTLSE